VFGLGFDRDHDDLDYDPIRAAPAGKLEAGARMARRLPAKRRSTGWN
jgi:hypothetical protein